MSITREDDYNALFVQLAANVIDRNIDKIFKAFGEKTKEAKEKLKVLFGTVYKQYLKNSFDKYSTIKTIIHNTQPKFLYDLFVYSNLSLNRELIDASNIENLISTSRYLILRGSGGFGKSTMMKHFFLNTIENKKRIPIFIELKDIGSTNDTLLDFIFSSMKKLGLRLDRAYFNYALSGDSFVFLFDGFDEISNDKSERVFREINDMCDQFGENVYIISSRPTDTFISFQRFSIIDTQPLTKEQAIELIQKIDYDTAVKEKFLKALDDELFKSHETFASNPLLLNIMLLTYNNYAEVPAKKHIFYANAYETLFTKHDATKGGFKRQMKTGLASNEFKTVFSEFCFLQFCRGRVDFDSDEIRAFLDKSSIKKYNLQAGDYIWDLEKAVCLIQKDGIKYKFIHRSFQEYFAACYIKDLSDELLGRICFVLISTSNKLRSDSIIEMLFDMIRIRFEYKVIIPFLRNLESGLKNLQSDREKFFYIYDRFFESIVFQALTEGDEFYSTSEKRYTLGVVLNSDIITMLIIREYCNKIRKDARRATPNYHTYSELFDLAKMIRITLDALKTKTSVEIKISYNIEYSFRLDRRVISLVDDLYTLIQNSFIQQDIEVILDLRKILDEQFSTSSYELEQLLYL